MPSRERAVLSLMAGVAFAGVAVAGLLGGRAGFDARWTRPVFLIVVGGSASSPAGAARGAERHH